MCGITGLVTRGALNEKLLWRLIVPLRHRGPDDEGVWIDSDAGVGLGHRRLSIIDLSPQGHQPMHSANGRYVITFNGEIYNHLELRSELEEAEAIPSGGWRGHSDSETLLETIAAWGLERTLAKAVGMFAFALWDRHSRTLSLVRDRFGEKPLYYGWIGKDFVFASELKALRAHPRFDNPVHRRALGLFASRTYIPAPLSIYHRIFKLPPGCLLTLTVEAAQQPLNEPPQEGAQVGGLNLHRYWSYRDVIRRGLQQPIADEDEALDELERVLTRAIHGQSVADVPVGAFLSGGIDSSTIVALYQKYSPTSVRTFSIGFEEAGFNEAEHAKAVAAHFGTVHNEHYVTVKEARDVIPLLGGIYDEPFADSSQIPTFLVSQFAREQVTVALTGDGGDELFGGYNRHFLAPKLWQHLQRVPLFVRSLAGSQLARLPSSFWSGVAALLPGRIQPHLGAKIQKTLRIAGSARSFNHVYASFLDEWSLEQSPVLGSSEPELPLDIDFAAGASDSLRMMYFDAVSYLPDDILCKVDRASMAVSLETRVPFLDHRVAELAACIPLAMKIRDGSGKQILRKLLYREAPQSLFDRPKAGFAVPVGEWIKGPLRPWAEELLDPARMVAEGWLDANLVGRRWRDHLSGRRESTPAIWAILMFQSWLRAQEESVAVAA
ncbi:MAG: asparagine synthase (glutamine-hydrolyzing) [Sphingomicrobium sp.]